MSEGGNGVPRAARDSGKKSDFLAVVMTAAYWRLAWLRYAQIVAVSSLAALAAAVLAVHLQSGRDDDDDDDGGGDDKSNRVGGPSQSRVQFANSVFAAVLWLLVTSAVLLGPYTKFSLLARAEWSGRSASTSRWRASFSFFCTCKIVRRISMGHAG